MLCSDAGRSWASFTCMPPSPNVPPTPPHRYRALYTVIYSLYASPKGCEAAGRSQITPFIYDDAVENMILTQEKHDFCARNVSFFP